MADREVRTMAGWRAARALSQRALAERSGVALSTVIRIERGAPMRPGSVGKLVAALGIEPDQLQEWVTQNKAAPEANPGGG